MTSKQRQAWRELCLKAVQEPDPAKQMEIVAELNRMLQRRQKVQPSPAYTALKQRPSRQIDFLWLLPSCQSPLVSALVTRLTHRCLGGAPGT